MSAIATAGDAMLADIIHDPHDDGLRLIYADWLEDHGQPERAEFVRNTAEPQAGFVNVWAEGDVVAPRWTFNATYRLGFADTVRLRMDEWRQHGPALVRRHPLTRVEWTDELKRPISGGFRRAGWQCRDRRKRPAFLRNVGAARATIPAGIFTRLRGVLPYYNWTVYADDAEAIDALSDACLSWAWSEEPS